MAVLDKTNVMVMMIVTSGSWMKHFHFWSCREREMGHTTLKVTILFIQIQYRCSIVNCPSRENDPGTLCNILNYPGVVFARRTVDNSTHGTNNIGGYWYIMLLNLNNGPVPRCALWIL